jgi:hypothetical protein
MSMKSIAFLLIAGVLASAPACKSHSTTDALSPADATIPCTCGTPEAQIDGCANPICLSGKTNPDNPNCVCGNLTIAPAKQK